LRLDVEFSAKAADALLGKTPYEIDIVAQKNSTVEKLRY